MRRHDRFLTAAFTVFALLFAQLAGSAYACPAMSAQAVSASSEAASQCDKLDPQLTNLCQKHCHGVEQSPSASPAPAPFIPALIGMLEPALQVLPIANLGPPALFHANSPPLTVRNCCFRI